MSYVSTGGGAMLEMLEEIWFYQLQQILNKFLHFNNIYTFQL
jgi:3-phosphoglycerate kinase